MILENKKIYEKIMFLNCKNRFEIRTSQFHFLKG